MASETAVTFLLEQVEAVLETYGDLISGAKEEFELLNSDLRKLKTILKRRKEEQIREDVYEIQDTIDDLLAQGVAIKSKHGSRRFALGRLSTSSTNLAKKVKSLREDKVKQVLQKAETMTSADEPAGGTSAREHSETIEKVFDKVPPETVVGFEDEERILVGYLTEEKNKLDIISIIGIPGLGKSTLASKIFQDKRIRYEFPIRIWVHVSREFNFRDVCLKIMKMFTDGREMSSMKDEELREAVRACLMEEKFLLVMDDVGSAKDWGEFKKVLPDDNGKGKVVITSREMGVGTYAKKITEPHMLRFLTGDESWELLQLEVFGDLQSCRGELEGIGRKIVEECGGVPLQIVVMGGILRHAPAEKNAWMEISKKVNRGDASQADYMEKVMSDLLQLSYDRLPYDLREPFIYLGVFPPDYEIPTWTLTCLWIAEGFIPPKDNRSFEETAKEYLDDLVDWNLLMVVRRNPMGEVKSCCVNGMIRSFCRVKAAKQHLFQEIKMSEREAAHQVEYCNRCLCLYSHISTFFRRGVKGPHARSFLSFQMEHIKIDQEYNSTISNSFPLLRILHAGSTRFIEFPIKIVNLIHLRYIVLCVDDLQILPEAISHLWNLQTIVVDTMSRTLTMEANIWRMIWLRHLKTRAKIVLGDKWQGEGGRNLQTVSRLSASSTEAICKRASNLKTLAIRGELAKLFNMSLQNLTNLENLKLENDLMHEPASENPLHPFLKPNSFPTSLRRLTLSNTYLDWKHMRAVAGIRNLKVLKLKNNAFSGLSWDAVDYVISDLEYLLIADANLVLWEASTSTFPSLRCLVLKNCENLKEIPASISESLLKIQVDGVRKSAVESARKIEEHLRNSKPGNRFQLSVGYSK